MSESADTAAKYWEFRALRYARERDGLAAVCSYGMPQFYNRAIEICQRRALRPWLANIANMDVLEIGCGVGRWTERLAANRNRVCALDLSPTMAAQARSRLAGKGLCADIRTADVSDFEIGSRFDVALSVTVMQHIMDEGRFVEALRNVARHLRSGGRFVLLEAAPTRPSLRCDSPVFHARPLDEYLSALIHSGFRVDGVSGVDPMPLKTWLLPYLARMPRPFALAASCLVTAASLPFDLSLAAHLPNSSWHKVIIATKAG